jgi:hypothetical protein
MTSDPLTGTAQELLPQRLRARHYEPVVVLGLAPEPHEAHDVAAWMRPRADMPETRASRLQRWSGMTLEEFEACFACSYVLDRPLLSRAMKTSDLVRLAHHSLHVILRALPKQTPVIVLGSELMQAFPGFYVKRRRAIAARWYSYPAGVGRIVAWLPDTVCDLEGYVWWADSKQQRRASRWFVEIAELVLDYGGDHALNLTRVGVDPIEYEPQRVVSERGQELQRAVDEQRAADRQLGPLWQRKWRREA